MNLAGSSARAIDHGTLDGTCAETGERIAQSRAPAAPNDDTVPARRTTFGFRPRTAPQRFVAGHAELWSRGARREITIALREDLRVPKAHPAEQRTLQLVLQSFQWPSTILAPGRFRVRPRAETPNCPIQAAAYLVEVDRSGFRRVLEALDGRVVLTKLTFRRAMGAFEVTFSTVRFHGTFLAHAANASRREEASEESAFDAGLRTALAASAATGILDRQSTRQMPTSPGRATRDQEVRRVLPHGEEPSR
jgi:hypothetical protein